MKLPITIALFATLFSAEISYSQQSNANAVIATDTVSVKLPDSEGSVNDFENIFTAQQIAELNKIISDFKKETGNRIVIASISNIAPYEKFDVYALDLSNHWGVGAEDKNNGLTLMYSRGLRQIRISTGANTEKIISDEACQKIIDEAIIPEFKKGNFYEGVKLGVLRLIELWQ